MDDKISVHGGITYSAYSQGRICHVELKNDPEKVWWVGFDCSHAQDMAPALNEFTYSLRGTIKERTQGTYRDIAYVTQEVEQLADQLAAVKEGK
jgi:hypothetical protein